MRNLESFFLSKKAFSRSSWRSFPCEWNFNSSLTCTCKLIQRLRRSRRSETGGISACVGVLLDSEAAARRERQARKSFSRACDSSHSLRGFKALNPFKGPFGFSVKSRTRYILLCYYIHRQCERFEPRSHFKSRLSLIVRVNVVLNRTVVVDSD